jgi:RimJ/RimL family protein N-acetyltransferase
MYKLREATEKDFESICKLIKTKEELYRVYPNGKYPFTIDQVKQLSQLRTDLTVLINNNQEIIGFANFYNYKPKKSAFIGNVIIAKAYRGKGLGKKIISYMLKKASEQYQLKEVKISVFSENIPALLLYSSFGFVPYEIEERKNPENNKVVLIHMKISL